MCGVAPATTLRAVPLPRFAGEDMTEASAALDRAIVRYRGLGRPIGPIDLSIAPGEIVALVGASGAGKSTTLRLLAGLERPSEGEASTPPPGRTGLVFQASTLMPWATALANVALPLRLSRVPELPARDRARQALAAVGLADRAEARPHQLSGGQAMRVSLARALVTRPELLLLDEPFAALDSLTRRALVEDLHRLWAVDRPAIVFVTHDVEEAVYVAARVVVLGPAGAVAADLLCPGPLPRPTGWRADPAYRGAVEGVIAAFEGAQA